MGAPTPLIERQETGHGILSSVPRELGSLGMGLARRSLIPSTLLLLVLPTSFQLQAQKPGFIALWAASESPTSLRPEGVPRSLLSERGTQKLLKKRPRDCQPRLLFQLSLLVAWACQPPPLSFSFLPANAFVYLKHQVSTGKPERVTSGSRLFFPPNYLIFLTRSLPVFFSLRMSSSFLNWMLVCYYFSGNVRLCCRDTSSRAAGLKASVWDPGASAPPIITSPNMPKRFPSRLFTPTAPMASL